MVEELVENEEGLQMALEVAEAFVWEWDLLRNFFIVSPNADRFLGRIPKNYGSFLQCIHPEDRFWVQDRLTQTLTMRQECAFECRIAGREDSVHWVRQKVTVNPMERPLRMIGAVVDITERKQTEGRLLVQYAITKVLAEAVSLPEATLQILQAICQHLRWDVAVLWSLDPTHQVLRCVELWHDPVRRVPRFEAATRGAAYARDRSLPGQVLKGGEAIWIANIGSDPSFIRGEAATREGLRGAFAFPIRGHHQVLGVMEFFSREIRQPDDQLLHMMAAIGTQIGHFIERKQSEEILLRYATIVENSEDAIFASTLDGCLSSWNPGAEQLYGYPAREAIGRPESMLAPADQALAFVGKLALARQGHHIPPFETKGQRKDGTAIDVSISIAPIKGRDGRITGVSAIVRNIEEQQQLEEQVRQSQKLEAIGRLAGGVAHDFNNLLTIISGYSELLLRRIPDPMDPAQELISQIQKAGDRAASLTRQLLAFSRKQVLEPRVLDLNAIVSDTEKMLCRLIGEDIQLATVMKPGLGRVKVDPGQIEQVIMNLAVNARDAMPQGGKLSIETDNVELDEVYVLNHPEVKPGCYVMLAITDTGYGMDELTKARIFEPFFTTKGPGKGTGLGLATVYGIIQQSGGHVWVYSEVDHGTSFKIYLPRVEEHITVGKSHAGLTVPPRGAETLLLVEDEDAVRTITRFALESFGYTVLDAGTGREAIRLCESHSQPIHLLLSDVVMPEMGGRQLAETLRSRNLDMKVLFLSGYTDDAIVRHGVLAAETAFLQKPFTLTALAYKVREVLDSKN